MSKFKKGDIVICRTNQGGHNYLTPNKSYTVLKYDGEYLCVYNDEAFVGCYSIDDFDPIVGEKDTSISDQPVVSDGLSTSYYKLTITNKAGEYISCEMGDVIRAVVGNDFDLGNVLKAARRMYEASQGRGKKDVTMHYDANKIAYFSKEFADWNED